MPNPSQEQVLFYIGRPATAIHRRRNGARGNGQYLAETAALRYGARIEQVMLSIEWYRENMPRYKAAFEDGNINLPRDASLLADHRMLKMEKGIARIPDTRITDQHGTRHGDTAIAGALALYASYQNRQEYAYQPAHAPAPTQYGERSREWEEDNLHSGRWNILGGVGRGRSFGKGSW